MGQPEHLELTDPTEDLSQGTLDCELYLQAASGERALEATAMPPTGEMAFMEDAPTSQAQNPIRINQNTSPPSSLEPQERRQWRVKSELLE